MDIFDHNQVKVDQQAVENPETLSEENPEPIEIEDELEKDSGSKVSEQHF